MRGQFSDLRIMVAQIGARRHYAVPSTLARVGCLERLETTFCAHHPAAQFAGKLPHWAQPRSLKRLLQRKVPNVPEHKIRSSLLTDVAEWYRSAKHEHDAFLKYSTRNITFAKRVAARGFGNANIVYGFNAACLEIFRRAAPDLGCVLDQTMAPWRYVESLLQEERAAWPGWEAEPVNVDSWRLLADREEHEFAMADCVICGSKFVVDALAEIGSPTTKCAIVPYDPPVHRTDFKAQNTQTAHGTLNVLFAGTICLRKGIQYLWKAAEHLSKSKFDIRAVGPISITDRALSLLKQRLSILGPCTRDEMAEQYRWADVLVLPTLAEGSANVTYEASCYGIPVLTTPNAGSTIRDGKNGYIIPIRSATAIQERLIDIASRKADIRHDCSASIHSASYGERLVAAIESKVHTRFRQMDEPIQYPPHTAGTCRKLFHET